MDIQTLLQSAIRDIPDFPKPGILFKDITPILLDPEIFRSVVDALTKQAAQYHPKKIVGIDARGFIFGAPIAYNLGIGFVPIRKKGKLPYQTQEVTYDLEYGTATLEIHSDAILPEDSVVIIDDLLATGGTSRAANQLVRDSGGKVEKNLFIVELLFLNGAHALPENSCFSLVQF